MAFECDNDRCGVAGFICNACRRELAIKRLPMPPIHQQPSTVVAQFVAPKDAVAKSHEASMREASKYLEQALSVHHQLQEDLDGCIDTGLSMHHNNAFNAIEELIEQARRAIQ